MSKIEQRPNAIVAEVMVRALARHGVEMIFGQSIPTQIHLHGPAAGIRQVGYRTENAGTAMADGYARVSGKIGVVSAQNGPAATLLVPGLAEALKASAPVLALVQDVSLADTDKNAFQELDHVALFAGCTKWLRRITQPERVEDYVDMAVAVATSGRPGPVVLLCPLDLLSQPAKAGMERTARNGHYPLDRPVADPARIAEAADLIAAAERPLVIAGGGVHSSQGCAALAALQEKAHLPVGTTSMGKGTVSELHPLSVGVAGYFMGPRGMARYMRPLVTEADVIVLIGNRTNQNGTDGWSLYPRGARYIHIDIDGEEIGRNYEALRLLGDAKATIEALTDALAKRDLGKRAAARPRVEAAIAEGRAKHDAESADYRNAAAAPARPERLMRDLDSALDDDDIVVADASYSSVWMANYLRARRPGMRFISPRGIAGLGWGFPMALGAKAARPDATVYNISGDGGFGHVWSELETAKRMGLKVVVTVLNNQILGYQMHAEDVIFGAHTDACDFAPVDHAMIARACGCIGVRVEHPDGYLPALREAVRAELPTVIDVVTDPQAYPPVSLYAHKS